jgi:hydrogenase nickel incorporation protein HypA/HybF
MHEASIALAIVDEVCERVERERIERVQAVYVEVGALSGVVPDALRFAWDLAAEGSPASGSVLQIERVPLRIRCVPCNAVRTADGTVPVCPQCGTPSSEITGGRELLVRAMEVTYAVAPGGSSAEHSAQEHYFGT